MGEEFFNRLENGTLRVVGELSADRREYTFTLIDERGKVLDTITDVNNITGNSRTFSSMDAINRTSTVEHMEAVESPVED